jgi:prepilin-type N-terminal cleavage/methylation domain-containing protein
MNTRSKLGFTLIEILTVIAIMAVLTAAGYLVAVKVGRASAEAKLKNDVAMLNRAVQTYTANGGVLDEAVPTGQVLTADKVLEQLRRVAGDARKHSGLRGSMVDPRLSIQMQSTAEAASSDLRAYWNNDKGQFELASSGNTPGIREFKLLDVAQVPPAFTNAKTGVLVAAGADSRKTALPLGQTDKWVWDYTTPAFGSATGPTDQVVTEPGKVSDPPTNEKTMIALDPPEFSLAAGAYALSEYPKTLTLSLPAGATEETAQIWYVDPSTAASWLKYTGALSLNPGQSVTAKTVSLDPDNYLDSAERMKTYTSGPFVLAVSLTFAKTAYNYGELGGALASGSVAAAAPGVLTVTGASGVASQYLNSTNFQLYWTVDGSDPAVSSTRLEAPAFSGTPPTVAVPLSLAGYSAAGTMTVRAVAISKNAGYFQNSAEVVRNLGIEKTVLTTLGVLYNGTTVSIAPLTSGGQPVGTRIFYTSSGNDPGDNGTGDPSAGDAVAYSAPLTPTALQTQYSARLYPPVGYKPWFTPGPMGATGVTLPAAGNYYASNAGESSLYQFNPSTGTNIVLSNGCLFAPASVAYLSTPAPLVYYVEQAASNWRLASYAVSTNVHTNLGSLTSAGWSYVPNSRPSNLTAYNGSVFYIPNQTDDLIRIDFNADGTILDQYKFADITGDTASFQTIGDIAVTPGGLLYVSASNAWAVFDVRSLAPITVATGTPAWVWNGLLTNPSGTLLGVRSTEPTKLYTVNTATGVGSSPLVFNPARSFDDFGSPVSDIPITLPATHFAISPGRQTLYRVDLETGRNYPVRTGLGFSPGAIAYQPGTGKVLLGTSTDFQLYQYSPSDGSLRHPDLRL